jgi:asparagine synthase (glutamine-hydrolysing)
MIFEGALYLDSELDLQLQETTDNILNLTSDKSHIKLDLGHRTALTYFIHASSKTFSNFYGSGNTANELSSVNEDLISQIALRNNPQYPQQLDLGISVKSDKEILLFRDAFGAVPLYYFHIPGSIFIFSTSLAHLVKNTIVNSHLEVNPNTIKDYCTKGRQSSDRYNSSTFFTNIKTALPGHILSIGIYAVNSIPYLQFDSSKYSSLTNKDQYCQSLFRLLKNSVTKASMDAPFAAHLSGGLDSSTVVALFRDVHPDKPLVTYFSLEETKNDDSTDYAELVAEKVNSRHYKIPSYTNDLELIKKCIEQFGFPTYSVSSLAKTHSILSHAQKMGIKTILTGHCGDEIIGNGYDYLKSLFSSKKWDSLAEELAKRANDPSNNFQFTNYNTKTDKAKISAITNYYLAHRITDLIKQQGFDSIPTIREAVRYFNLSKLYVLRRVAVHFLRVFIPQKQKDLVSIKESNFDQKNYAVNFQSTDSNTNSKFISYINEIYSKTIVHSNEEHFALGEMYKTQIKLPFLDLGVLELCAATPEEYKYYIGSGRGHLRQAMSSLLPDKVIQRQDKGYFNDYARSAAKRLIEQVGSTLDRNSTVWNYVDYTEYKKIESAILKDDKQSKYYQQGSFYILRIVSLHIWFNWVQDISIVKTNVQERACH